MKLTSGPVRVLAGVVATLAVCVAAWGQGAYPARPIRLIVPQSAGSGGDIVGRMLGDYIATDLRQPVIVENKAGANGVVAAISLAKEAPDGYTVMLGLVSQLAFNKFLYKDIGYDGLKDFTYIHPVVETPYVLVLSKKSDIKSFAQLVQRAKSQPGRLNYASAGTGNMTHLSMALLANKAGITLTHIPYKGSGPALLSVVAGESDAMVSVLGPALPQIASHTVVPIAVSGDKRASQIPDVPTLAELGIQMPSIPGWYALVGPAHMPADVRKALSDSVARFLTDPAVTKKLASLYLNPMTSSGPELLKRAQEESRVWGGFIKENGISPE